MAQENKKSRGFIFTYNNPTRTPVELIKDLKNFKVKKAVFQLERGEETKTPHYQGYLYFSNARYEKAVSSALKIWCQAAENDHAVKRYAQKTATKEDGPWGFGLEGFRMPVEAVKIIENLRPWQEEIANITEREADERTIHWYWDPVGNMGKTVFSKWLVVMRQAEFVGGKAADAKFCIAKRLQDEEKPPLKVVVFGFTRTLENYVSYEAIESIKDGLFFSSKYESGTCCFNSPHVICFANFPPDTSKLSQDRWRIVEVKQEEENVEVI